VRDEAIPRITIRSSFSAAGFLSWLGGRPQLSAEYRALDSAVVDVIGAKREQVFEVNLRRVTDSAAKIIDWSRPGRTYVIAETILADSVSFSLASNLLIAASDSVRSDSLKAHGVAVRWEPGSSVRIALRFPQPYRVFYKADQIIRRAGFERDSLGAVLRVPVTAAIIWHGCCE
jgi:hypothetical protein